MFVNGHVVLVSSQKKKTLKLVIRFIAHEAKHYLEDLLGKKTNAFVMYLLNVHRRK